MALKPKEHEPSHIHALYGEYIGIFDLKTKKMTDGDLPRKAQELVEEWLSGEWKILPLFESRLRAGLHKKTISKESVFVSTFYRLIP